MTNYERRSMRRRPPLECSYIPYEERLRGQRRDRERNVGEIVFETRPWKIARITLSRLAGESELLRGITIIPTNQMLWWPARIMSHGEGLCVLQRNLMPDLDRKEIVETEVNLVDNNMLHFSWPAWDDEAEAEFLKHPIHAEIVDECLAARGRPIRRVDRRLTLSQIK